MDARLILSISSNGSLNVSLCGRGKARRKLFRAYEQSMECLLEAMERRVRCAIIGKRESKNENTNPDIN